MASFYSLLCLKPSVYKFDFLELAEARSERELEQVLVQNVRALLTELGGAFAFMGN